MVEINPFSALSSVGQASNDRKTIADNFETFLTLLTTQLQNQNPLDPLDTNQFTQQLVQFTEVEQSVKMNENLETLTQLSAANAITNAVTYIGKEVTISGKSAQFDGTFATWDANFAESSDAATFTILDSNGATVYSETRPVQAGITTFVWDGRTLQGGKAPSGTYTISVRAENGNGGTVPVTTAAFGIVEAVDLSGSEPVLTVSGREVRLDEITAIRAASNDDDPTPPDEEPPPDEEGE